MRSKLHSSCDANTANIPLQTYKIQKANKVERILSIILCSNIVSANIGHVWGDLITPCTNTSIIKTWVWKQSATNNQHCLWGKPLWDEREIIFTQTLCSGGWAFKRRNLLGGNCVLFIIGNVNVKFYFKGRRINWYPKVWWFNLEWD